MPEEKVIAAKRTVKKVAAAPEVAKPKKAASAPKAAVAGNKKNASTAVKVDTPVAAKVGSKAVMEKAAPSKSSKAPVAPKVAVSKPTAAKPESEVKKSAVRKLVKKPAAPSMEERQRWIATAAYHRAEKRGFAPGYEVQDWFDAEAEIAALVGKS